MNKIFLNPKHIHFFFKYNVILLTMTTKISMDTCSKNVFYLITNMTSSETNKLDKKICDQSGRVSKYSYEYQQK